MKKLFVIFMVLIIAIIFVLYRQPSEEQSTCCAQCLEASGYDTATMLPAEVDCSNPLYVKMTKFDAATKAFTDEPVFTSQCLKYFESNPTTLATCQHL